MNTKLLSTSIITSLLGGLAHDQAGAFAAIEEIAGLHAGAARLHGVFLHLDDGRPVDPAAAALTAALREADLAHDASVRAFHEGMSAYASWLRAQEPPDLSGASRAEALRDEILPSGLSVNNMTYLDEAGQALQVVAQLSPARRAALEAIPIAGVDALTLVRRRGVLGARLQELSHKRSLLPEPPSDLPSAWDARNQFARLVNAIEAGLALSGAPAARQEAILKPIREAVKAAEARTARGEKGGEPSVPEAEPAAASEGRPAIDRG